MELQKNRNLVQKASGHKLYFDSKLFVTDLLNDIDDCKRHIRIEMYIWASDAFAQQLEQKLVSAAHRGVKVQILVDGIGSYEWIQKGRRSLEKHGIAIKVFNPLPTIGSFFLLPKKLAKLFGLINRRNHRKLIIIDDEICYLGSLNIMKEAVKWRENGLRVTGETVKLVSQLHYDAWKRPKNFFSAKGKQRKRLFRSIRANRKIQTTQYAHLRHFYRSYFLESIQKAHFRVWLITPYFNPPRGLLNVLLSAAERGVDVRLILPSHSDVPYLKWMANQYYKPMLYAGIKIYEYQPRILHAKGSLVDDIGTIGSGNLNYRSFFKDIELNMIINQQSNIEELEKQFDIDFRNSKRIVIPENIVFWKKWIAYFLSFYRESF